MPCTSSSSGSRSSRATSRNSSPCSVASLVTSTRSGGEVVYSVSVPEVRDLLLAARAILSGIIVVRAELEPELTGTATESLTGASTS